MSEDIAKSFARCFRGTDGDKVLAHIMEMTVARQTAPGITDAELRHLEGQRHLAHTIINLVKRGQEQ